MFLFSGCVVLINSGSVSDHFEQRDLPGLEGQTKVVPVKISIRAFSVPRPVTPDLPASALFEGTLGIQFEEGFRRARGAIIDGDEATVPRESEIAIELVLPGVAQNETPIAEALGVSLQ